jgi:hypothetical protein
MLKVNFGENIGTDLTPGNHGGGTKTFHGSGLTVVPGRYCETCLKKGHQCPAREGSDECIFCEDKAPCPVMQRAATEHTRVTATPRLVGEDSKQRGRYGQKLAKAPAAKKKPIVTVHAAQPAEFLKNGGGELIRAAAKYVKEIAVNETAKTCSECGKALRSNNTSGRCSKHFYIPKNGKRRAGAKVKTKTQRKAAKVAAASNDNGSRAAASLVLTEQQLDDLFLGQDLEAKVSIIQGWLDRERA